MYPIPKDETLVETKVCKYCGVSFPITDKDLEFYDKVSPVFAGKKYQIPTPTLCPDCRQQRRLSFRNERKLYKRKCDATGRDIISIYSPDKPFKVYHQDFWWSDKWDPMDYGRDFDFTRPFFEQFGELMREVPRLNIFSMENENGDYLNFEAHSKDCYLNVGGIFNQDSYYNTFLVRSSQCIDNFWVFDSEFAYECIDSYHSFDCHYIQDCVNCWNCTYCNHLISCKNCLGCIGLKNQEFHILNRSVNEKTFYEIKDKLQTDQNFKIEFLTQWNRLIKNFPKECMDIQGSSNVIGDHLKNSYDLYYCFDGDGSRQCRHCVNFTEISDTADCYGFGPNGELGYEILGIFGVSHHPVASLYSNTVHDVFYSDHSHFSSHLFACIGLRNKQYCILNKQYTREEYEELVPRIIEHMMKTGEWGEFFPSSMSPFGYNETVAQEYYPLNKEEATKNGVFKWSDYEAPFPRVEKIIPAAKLPDDITKIPDDILNWAIECEVSGKPFRIIKQELEFYRKHNLPIPRRHPDQRHLDRMALRNPRKLFERKCDKCGVDMMTTYSPERPEVVYCEGCYNKEVL